MVLTVRSNLQFLSRPFVVGDRVELSTAAGAKFMVGYVERVDPMRTIFRTDACLPVMIPNKVSQCQPCQSSGCMQVQFTVDARIFAERV